MPDAIWRHQCDITWSQYVKIVFMCFYNCDSILKDGVTLTPVDELEFDFDFVVLFWVQIQVLLLYFQEDLFTIAVQSGMGINTSLYDLLATIPDPLMIEVGRNNFMTRYTYMMTSSTGNIFRVTGHLRGVPSTKASVAEPWFFSLICTWINDWINNREVRDLYIICKNISMGWQMCYTVLVCLIYG